MGLAFIALAVLILGVFGWFATITPDYYIYVTENGLGAGSSLPANVTGSVSIKAIVGIIVGFAEVLLVVSGIRRLGYTCNALYGRSPLKLNSFFCSSTLLLLSVVWQNNLMLPEVA